METGFVDYVNLIEIVGAILYKIAIFVLETHLRGPCVWIQNVHIHRTRPVTGKLLIAGYE
jgi:hypothetical protein